MGNAPLLSSPSYFAPNLGHPISYFALDIEFTFTVDCLFIIYNIDEVAPIVKSAMLRVMPSAIELEERLSEAILRWNLRGPVLRESGDTLAFARTQAILCSVFEALLRHGWRLAVSANIRRTDKRCTLFFQRSAPTSLGRPLLAVCIRGEDKVCLVNADAGAQEAVRAQIAQHWSKGIHSVETYDANTLGFRLAGRPWHVRSFCEDLNESRQAALSIVGAVERLGFDLYASSHPGGVTVATDSIYFTPREKAQPPAASGEAFVLGLLCKNDVYLVRAPDAVIDLVRGCIAATWRYGLESEHASPDMFVFRLRGHPWVGEALYRAVGDPERRRLARLLLVRVFEGLRRSGWRIHSTLDLAFAVDDASCFLVRQCPPEAGSAFMAIGMHGRDRLRLVNAAADVERHFVEEFAREWPGCLGVALVGGCVEVALPGPFEYCIGVLCLVLERLRARGWEPVSAADLSINYMKVSARFRSSDLDTLFLERRSPPPDSAQWAAGAEKM